MILLALLAVLSLAGAVWTIVEVGRDGYRPVPLDPRRLPPGGRGPEDPGPAAERPRGAASLRTAAPAKPRRAARRAHTRSAA